MTWTIVPTPVGGPAAVAVFRAYLADIVSRYHGRPATDSEVEAAAADAPGDGLAPPHGTFLLARDSEGAVVGCAGVRLMDAKIAELTRVWTAPCARGRGLGSALVAEAEQAAVRLGASAVRLDTRHDLTEARRLYARLGYAEIAPYHDGPYADHFFEKRLLDD
ncbi:GNAT family N-acetyltransferase [Streptomyces ovatisporus]|uniref:GNAT family N-acetyltransferase n=1 Tax=Streptomyces ovatisporus TaxID=1128682 RepID=A0ABV8ZY88_9ACTN